jgi:hypothetical protein
MATERRRYYRIEDLALIKYRLIADDELALARAEVEASELQGANVQAALMPLEVELQDVLGQLRLEQRLVADAVAIVNRKIGLLASVLALEHRARDGAEYREHVPSTVSLSGGGLGLKADYPLALNAYVLIDLVLLPSNHPLSVIGRVVECRRAADDNFTIGIEFDRLKDAEREVLVRHILRKQSALLRENRGSDGAVTAD